MKNDIGFENKVFSSLSPGDYDAVIHGVIVLGRHPVEYKGEKKTPAIKIKIVYEVPSEIREDKETYVIGQSMRLSSSDQSNFYGVVSAAILSTNNKEKIKLSNYTDSTGLQKLLGKCVVIKVDQWEKEDNLISFVSEVSKLDSRLPQPKRKRDLFFFNPLNPDLNIFKNTLTFNTQKTIMESLDSDQFPKELHGSWTKIQEDRDNSKEKNNEEKDLNNHDISAIQ